LGKDPNTGLDVLLMRGPYGYYVQLGPTDPKAETKPKRAAWPKNTPIATAELDAALKLLALPRLLGSHPQSGKPVEASIGPFGPYVKHDGGYKSIPKSDSVYDIALDRAVELLAAPKTARTAAGKPLGVHPDDQKPVALLSGRYGPYVKHGKLNATVSQDYDAATLTLEQALEILATKQAKSGKSGNLRSRSKKDGTAKTSKGATTVGRTAKTTARISTSKPRTASTSPAAAAAKKAPRKSTQTRSTGGPAPRRKTA
jgi:DNA topoisomerase-1